MSSAVLRVTAAGSEEALKHFEQLLKFETDCWDVHHALTNGLQDFVLVDVRAEVLFEQGHIEGAINIPQPRLNEKRLAEYPTDTLFVVYCAGPHCNGTEKAAIRLAKLGRPVKKMIGGVTGWLDEGFTLVSQEVEQCS
ncbi:rhodanese-like domain-containing protein [Vibrio brasiliensis]|jgi:rhodanese-related sulfurtransferase|uniref:rhodanese-like domain-containing protein n=1 Tax=Vibrio brasiliensis TaxID=170652 RepID=UPI001EFCE469|nr:rhodanese-like domain-containing protein [Vibrio brasiliensis]MCG9750952.1 rhodanese-like domain-containing protein [Vibrio brasiliensis]